MAENEAVIDLDYDYDSQSENGQPPSKRSKKAKTYKQKYNKLWEQDSLLKEWLAPVKGHPYKAYCKCCKTELIAGLSELKKHSSTRKHIENKTVLEATQSITTMMASTSNESVKRAEMKVAAFIVEHNLSFQVTDHLSDLVADIFHDSKIASQFKSKHTKTRCIVKHVLADTAKDKLVNTLRNTNFSIIIDESTDVLYHQRSNLQLLYDSFAILV